MPINATVKCDQCGKSNEVQYARYCTCYAFSFCDEACFGKHPHALVNDEIHGFHNMKVDVQIMRVAGRGPYIDLMTEFIDMIVRNPETWDFTVINGKFTRAVDKKYANAFSRVFSVYTDDLYLRATNPTSEEDYMTEASESLIQVWESGALRSRGNAVRNAWTAFTDKVDTYLRNPTPAAGNRLHTMAIKVGRALNGAGWTP